MGLLRAALKSVRTSPSKAEDLTVEVRDTDGRLICWGGPYTSREALAAVELFEERTLPEP